MGRSDPGFFSERWIRLFLARRIRYFFTSSDRKQRIYQIISSWTKYLTHKQQIQASTKNLCYVLYTIIKVRQMFSQTMMVYKPELHACLPNIS